MKQEQIIFLHPNFFLILPHYVTKIMP